MAAFQPEPPLDILGGSTSSGRGQPRSPLPPHLPIGRPAGTGTADSTVEHGGRSGCQRTRPPNPSIRRPTPGRGHDRRTGGMFDFVVYAVGSSRPAAGRGGGERQGGIGLSVIEGGPDL
jgi:hypothetical protein